MNLIHHEQVKEASLAQYLEINVIYHINRLKKKIT